MGTRHHDPAALSDDRVRAVQRACGEHLSSFHDAREDHRQLAAAFAVSALAAGERFVYAARGDEREPLREAIATRGVDASDALRGGQLTTLAFADLSGSPDGLDLDAVLATYRTEADRSVAAGYPGLRLAVEMGALVDTLGDVERVVRWESEVGALFGALGVTAICQYDAERFDAAARAHIAELHHGDAVDDSTTPLATFETVDGGDLRVVGELDLTTADRFARTLAARAAVRRRLRIDVSGVGFTDVRGLRTVFEVAQALPPGSKLVLANAHDDHRRLLELVGWQDSRVEVEPR